MKQRRLPLLSCALFILYFYSVAISYYCHLRYYTVQPSVAGTPVKSEGFYWSTVSLHCGKLCMISNPLTYETNIWNEENFQPVFTVFKYQVVFCS